MTMLHFQRFQQQNPQTYFQIKTKFKTILKIKRKSGYERERGLYFNLQFGRGSTTNLVLNDVKMLLSTITKECLVSLR